MRVVRLLRNPLGQIGVSILAGASAATAFAPYHFVPMAIVALACLARLSYSARSPAFAFALGWFFGLGYFTVGLHWVAASFFVDAERFGALAFPAIAILAGGLALFPGLACAVVRALRTGSAVFDALLFGAAWTGAEWLRGTLLTGFPWNLIGHVWSVSETTMQLASVIGVYGLSFLTAVGAALIAPPFQGRSRRTQLVASAFLLATIWAGGQIRLMADADPGSTNIVVRMVQGNIPQHLKWRPDQQAAILDRYLELTAQPASRPITAVIWPEAAVPFEITEESDVRQRLASNLPPGSVLFAGAIRRETIVTTGLFNSIVAMDRDGQLLMTYDKVHLVPFGEYVPFRSILPLERLTVGATDVSPGHERSAVRVASLPPVAPMICYEAIFPLHGLNGEQPYWLLNVTNDAWFGRSEGPSQHLEIARFRAVEAGIPMIRVANTGISAVIDAFGRVKQRIEQERSAIVDVELPRRLPDRTLYAALGDKPLLTVVGLVILAGFFGRIVPRSDAKWARCSLKSNVIFMAHGRSNGGGATRSTAC